MKHYPSIRLLLAVLVFTSFLVLNSPHISAQENKAPGIRFDWAFGVIPSGETERRLVPVTEDTILHSGDRFRFFVKPETSCYIYLFYRSSRDDIALLFPYTFEQFSDDYAAGKGYYIPAGNNWFSLDDQTGLERFYLLAADRRLTELESLYHAYTSAPADGKPALAEQIVRQIRQLRRKRRQLSAAAERPASIGGNLRGSVLIEGEEYPDVASIAAGISEDDFFARTFTIEHR